MPLINGARLWLFAILLFSATVGPAADPGTPEEVLRALVRANAEKDFSTISRLMAHDEDIISYTIGGRKYVGWTEFTRDMQEEFASVTRLEIQITALKFWTHGEIAWFAMELDYIRYVGSDNDQLRTILPLRETGVLQRRNGHWVLLAWHESSRSKGVEMTVAEQGCSPTDLMMVGASLAPETPDLSGEWEIQEEDKSYRATLDRDGNGTYTYQGGRIVTTGFADRRWQGTWHQTGNDREGGFEVLLSEDGTEAKGVWWYTRVGNQTNIPPRGWGGTYLWKRLTPLPASISTH